MRNLDETDLEIIQLLLEDSRRPFSEIAEHVDLSPPAVSDRIDRLEEFGVIRRFTLDVDRTKLQDNTSVLIKLGPKPDAVERVFERVTDLESVEHAFQLFDGSIVAHVNVPNQNVHSWARNAIEMSEIQSYEITPIARFEWGTGVAPSAFTISCAVCDKTVTNGGETAQFNGETKVFCCVSCRGRYEQQYESLQQGLE